MTRYLIISAFFILISGVCFAVCPYQLQGDVNADCKIDMSDIAAMASSWLVDCNIDPTNAACDETQSMIDQQKDQFRYIKDALELYRVEFGEYPPSNDNSSAPVHLFDATPYGGANKLAEALVGLDMLGVHPNTDFRADGQFLHPGVIGILVTADVYHPASNYTGAGNPTYAETALENIQNRKGPFIDSAVANAFTMDDIYEAYMSFRDSSLVLCDVFEKTRSTGKTTGMPILYYRARDLFTWQNSQSPGSVYSYYDNEELLELGATGQPPTPHPLNDGMDDLQDFDNMIIDPVVSALAGINVPYRPDGYILISAGFDGLYGTPDDQFDFKLLEDEPLPIPESKEIIQRAQFHAVEVALEMYHAEFGDYPPSNDNDDNFDPANNDPNDPTPYGGANKLAEALVGLDMLGVHPNTDFRADGQFTHPGPVGPINNAPVYHPTEDYLGGGNPTYIETALENLLARKGPFIDLQLANAHSMQDVYDTSAPPYIGSGFETTTLVLCDVFERKRSSGKKTGMPILYYKARTANVYQNAPNIQNDVYYYPDNWNLLELGPSFDAIYGSYFQHPLADGSDDFFDFEQMVVNPVIFEITGIKIPYRVNSFILISAGEDGLYGTGDDITNFNE